MTRLNQRYRKKNRPTDVLAFPGTGDVTICLRVAKRQAKDAHHSLRKELGVLCVHGILHLFGYDHEKSQREAKRMFRLQNEVWTKGIRYI